MPNMLGRRQQSKKDFLHAIGGLGQSAEQLASLPQILNGLTSIELGNDEIITVANDITVALRKFDSTPQGKKALMQFQETYFSSLASKALFGLETFNHKQLSSIVESFGSLSVNPGRYFMDCWSRRATQPHILWDREDIKRIRDADNKLGLNLIPEVFEKPTLPTSSGASLTRPANAAN